MNLQTTQIKEARAFVDAEISALPAVGLVLPTRSRLLIAAESLKECSICEDAKPAKSFRKVIGRTTTEACGECCDRRDEADGARDPLGPTAIAEFCFRVAMKRFERQARPANREIPRFPDLHRAVLTSSSRRRTTETPVRGLGAFGTAPARHLFHQEKAAPSFNRKEKSALAKSPEEYAKWLQKAPDRIAAIVAKTVAVKGDAFELEDDTALILIMDELNRGDDTLIERNAKKKLAPKKS